jgi:hypothetical protein
VCRLGVPSARRNPLARARDQPARVRMVRNARISVVGGPAAPTPRNKGLPLRFRQNYTESVGFLQIKGQVLPSLSPIPWSYSWYDRGSARRSSPDRIAGGASSASAFSWRLFDPGGTIPPGPHWVLPMPRGDPDRPLIAGFAREKQQADDDLIARASGESRRESETEDYGLNR